MTEQQGFIIILLVFAALGCLIFYGVWVTFSSRKPENYHIDPVDIGPFAGYVPNIVAWYVSRVREWPPVKFNQDRDRCGLSSIYKNNKQIVGKIKNFNSYKAFIEFNNGEIHVIPTLKNFTNFPEKIEFFEMPGNYKILEIKPFLTIPPSFDYYFSYHGKEYRFRSLSGFRYAAELTCEGSTQLIFAVVGLKQIESSIALSDPDPAVLLLCFDIFSRYVS